MIKNNFVAVLVACLLLLLTGREAFAQKTDECLNCHLQIGDKMQAPADAFTSDVHNRAGITCAGCHGGNPYTDDMEEGMSRKAGFLGVPAKKERYLVCIKCHADEKKMRSLNYDGPVDQYDKLRNSVHYKQSYNNQGPVADCITCHGAHGIASVKSPMSLVYPARIVALCGSCHSDAGYMKNYNPNMPVDQVIKYRTSVHGIKNLKGDVRTAQCESCHGSHGIRSVKDPGSLVYNINIAQTCARCHSDKQLMAAYKIPTDQYDKYKTSVHGVALLEKGDASAPACNGCHGNHGAVPPGIESISKVCGACHAHNLELFEKSPHKAAFEAKKIPECESCHGNHGIVHPTDELVGTDDNAICSRCHKPGDKGYRAAHNMKRLMDSLTSIQKTTIRYLNEANKLGMDVSDEEYALKDIRQIIIKTRTSIHTFNEEKYREEIAPGFELANETAQSGIKAVDNYYFRRHGLAVSTIIVSLLVAGLYFKLKKIEKSQSDNSKDKS